MPHAFTCQAAPPSDCSCFCCSSFFTFLLTVNIFVAFCLFCLYRLCSARCFLCNISTLQQRAKTLTLFTFTFSFCFVLFPAFLLHDANWLPACLGAGPVLCCTVQCSALPPSPLILDSAYLQQQQQHWESYSQAKAVWQVALHEPKKTPNPFPKI